MFKKNPQGYRTLLAYQKAAELQGAAEDFVKFFPRTKTFTALADQISRSARSVTKNIVEGWMRVSTKEYFEFLGFTVASCAEAMEDFADIACGVYAELMGVRGIMGDKGIKGESGVMGDKGGKEKGMKGMRGEKGEEMGKGGEKGKAGEWRGKGREDLESLKFYPVDENLPPAVKLYLRSKEVIFLLYRLQKSLDVKMNKELTKPLTQRFKENRQQIKNGEKWYEEFLQKQGLVRLENGQVVKRDEGVKREKGDERDEEDKGEKG